MKKEIDYKKLKELKQKKTKALESGAVIHKKENHEGNRTRI